jgi:hypothetical protein
MVFINNNIFKLVLFSFFFGIVLISSIESYPKKFDKKIKKEIKKTFKIDKFDVTIHKDTIRTADENIVVFDILADTKVGFAILTKAKGCLSSGCTSTDIADHDKEGFYEQYYFLTIYNNLGSLLKVKILEYESNYGYEIASGGWLKQFKDRRVGDLQINREIDGITGATISVKTLIQEINYQDLILEELIDDYRNILTDL